MLRTRARVLRAAAAVATLATGVGASSTFATSGTPSAPSAPSASAGNGCATSAAGGPWIELHPKFAVGGPQVSDLAAPPFDPNALFASNGAEIVRSVDTGCTWQHAFTAPAPPGLPQSVAAITALDVPSSANSSRFVYVGITTAVAGISHPSIAISTDRGSTWTTADANQGLPALGSVLEVTGNAQLPQIAYARIRLDVANTSEQAVYETNDGGASWTRRTPTTDTVDVAKLLANPVRQTQLFGVAGGRPVVSNDGGASFVTMSGATQRVGDLAIAVGAGDVRLAAPVADSPNVIRSTDGGRTWTRLLTPFGASSIAVAPLLDVIVLSDGLAAALRTPSGEYRSIGPPKGDAPLNLSVTAPTSVGISVTGTRSGAILRASFTPTYQPIPPDIRAGVPTPVRLLPPGVIRQFPATLNPGRMTVTLPAGASRVVPYGLLLPRTPTPVDLMFLVDTTNSMQPVIDGLRQGIARMVDALDTAGLDARIGVGDFRDYPAPYGPAEAGDWPYRLDRKVGRVDAQLRQAIAGLQAGGGTGDGGQSALAAIYQSTLGSGDHEHGITYVPRRSDAGYRRGALKLAMVSTDTEPHYGGQQLRSLDGDIVREPGPGYADVIDALRAKGVHSVGLEIKQGDQPGSGPALLRLARASSTFAPPGGVDCDGNGVIDVLAQAPLVCPIGSEDTSVSVAVGTSTNVTVSGMVAAVVDLANGIPDPQRVSLAVTRGRDVAATDGPSSKVVNVHTDNELPFGLRLTCPSGATGRHLVTVTALRAGTPVSSAGVDLHCDGKAAVAPLPLIGSAALIAAGPAPPVQPAPNPNPNPNPNPSPAPNVNLNAAVADQKQTQAQLAFDTADGRPVRVDQLSMSRRRPTETQAATWELAAAAVCMTGVAYSWRRRVGVVRARS